MRDHTDQKGYIGFVNRGILNAIRATVPNVAKARPEPFTCPMVPFHFLSWDHLKPPLS